MLLLPIKSSVIISHFSDAEDILSTLICLFNTHKNIDTDYNQKEGFFLA
jgi:hypothetical protein